MTAAEQQLDAIYARIGRGRMAREIPLQEVLDAAIVMAHEETGFVAVNTAKNLGITRSKMDSWLRGKREAAALAAMFLFICVHLCPSVAQAQVKGSAALIPSLAVADVQTNKQAALTWTSSESRFAIYTGTNRASLSQRTVITSNSFPVRRAMVYGVAAINTVGTESTIAFWPSNRVGELWTQTSTNLVTWQDSQRLERFTNTPARPQMYQRIVDKTTGWLPPN